MEESGATNMRDIFEVTPSRFTSGSPTLLARVVICEHPIRFK